MSTTESHRDGEQTPDPAGNAAGDPAPAAGPAEALPGGEPSAGALVLRVLRVSLHVGFALLLAVGLVRVLATATPVPLRVAAVALSCLLAAVYLTGTVWETRHARGRAGDPARWARAWLGLVVLLWLALMAIHADFSWLAFPLFFLHLHLLRQRPALLAIGLLTVVVVLAQWLHAREFAVAMLLGPLVGAAFSVVMGTAYRALYTEGVNQRRALEELRRTRAALAREEHRAGMLAERERLAREIHDTLAQGLSSIVLVARAARSALEAGDTDVAAQRIETMGTTAAENLDEARDFVRGLSAGTDEAASGALAGRFTRLCSATERSARDQGQDFRCIFRQDGDPVSLPAGASGALLRAAQSALANVVAHAGASRAVLSLGYLPDEVTLDVYDDGGGLDLHALPLQPRADGTGFGLSSLRARVQALGGDVDIESTPGEGTVIAVRIPLKEKPHGQAAPAAR